MGELVYYIENGNLYWMDDTNGPYEVTCTVGEFLNALEEEGI